MRAWLRASLSIVGGSAQELTMGVFGLEQLGLALLQVLASLLVFQLCEVQQLHGLERALLGLFDLRSFLGHLRQSLLGQRKASRFTTLLLEPTVLGDLAGLFEDAVFLEALLLLALGLFPSGLRALLGCALRL